MDLIKINDLAQSLMSERKAHLEREKGGIYHHGQRTANLALELRRKLYPDDTAHDDILTVAAWFHDCAKGIEPHEQYGSVVAKEALKNLLSDFELEKVCELIALHCARKPLDNGYDNYTKLIQDADLLDHFGVYEIWMNIQYWAHTGGSMDEMSSWYNENHTQHTERFRKLLNYDFSKEIYDDRVAFQNEYVARLNDEGAGKIHNKDQLKG